MKGSLSSIAIAVIDADQKYLLTKVEGKIVRDESQAGIDLLLLNKGESREKILNWPQ